MYTSYIPRLGATHLDCGCGIDAADDGCDAPVWAVAILERAARRKEFVHA
jgi:hypothetical protein